MRIVIDMQGAQAENRNRGIGRYVLALAQGITRNKGEHEVVLALNGYFSESVEAIRAAFSGLLPKENIHVWYPISDASHINETNDRNRKSSELLREAFLSSLSPDIILVSSLFEGLVDNAVTSVGRFVHYIPTAVVMYDLIPLIYRKPYLDNPAVCTWYEDKLEQLKRADQHLAISTSSRQESIEYLGSNPEHVVNISTAADPGFRPLKIDSSTEKNLRAQYGLNKRYVMYTGGIDHRKNIEGLIRAFAMLPEAIRQNYQLAIICSIQPQDRQLLMDLAEKHGLRANELVLTGFVPEGDLLTLYNLCDVFTFPSLHEGFGLPALEAMACGRAVIGSNCSSLPEVIGREDALFDPRDDQAISDKLKEVLTDTSFRQELERHGLEQAARFSWDKSAKLAIAALEEQHTRVLQEKANIASKQSVNTRPRLAYVSPLQPERSGISDYSAELLPELARFYDIEVILAQDEVTTKWIKDNCPQRTVEWFRENADHYDRVLYHFGNSSYHQHMFSLLQQIPGTVVLHDFFLSGIVAHMDVHGFNPGTWSQALYKSHGYAAVQHRFSAQDTADVVWKYPCNLDVLQNAQGVIVHSENSRHLAQQWYGKSAGYDWLNIPLLRKSSDFRVQNAKAARIELGIPVEQYVVCSFGLLGMTKLNHRLLDAWLNSPLAKDKRCTLIFVGENDAGEYGAELRKIIKKSGCSDRIKITGWADAEVFKQHLQTADVGVQLRTLSRGETSAAVLDCMNYGLATIVNSNGSMADLPDDGVWKLPDDFDDEELTHALTTLYDDVSQRKNLGAHAQEIIRINHAPSTCAASYAQAIESFHEKSLSAVPALVQEIATLKDAVYNAAQLREIAESIACSITPSIHQSQLFVDISELVQHDAKSGIQRVVRSILKEWLVNPPMGFRVEPVYATNESPYRYARKFTCEFLNIPVDTFVDEPVDYAPGDIFFALDLQPQVQVAQADFYTHLRLHGVKVLFCVYDLLCISLKNCFPEGAADGFSKWLDVVTHSNGAICISQAVANELEEWKNTHHPKLNRSYQLEWFHLGADVDNSQPTQGLPSNANQILDQIKSQPSFLMVGTLEPRKGHEQTFDAFELLWKAGIEANLVIVGKQGWMVEQLIERINNSPELGKRLFWLDGISDEYLEKVYAESTCLIAASYGEGFGLPLIEAAQKNLSILARDIPVFREVAGEYASYFTANEPSDLAQAIESWLTLYKDGKHPKSDKMPWLTWKESAANLLDVLGIANA